jgi:hypothetical protein
VTNPAEWKGIFDFAARSQIDPIAGCHGFNLPQPLPGMEAPILVGFLLEG